MPILNLPKYKNKMIVNLGFWFQPQFEEQEECIVIFKGAHEQAKTPENVQTVLNQTVSIQDLNEIIPLK